MIIENRRGETALIMLDNCYGEDAIIYNDKSWTGLDGFNEDMIWHDHQPRDGSGVGDHCASVDIMKVYTPDLPTGFLGRIDNHERTMKPIWERKEIPEYTMVELTEKIGHEFKLKK